MTPYIQDKEFIDNLHYVLPELSEHQWKLLLALIQGRVVSVICQRDEELLGKEICICAAVKDTNGTIWRGHRHGNCFQTIQQAKKEIDTRPEAQGFVTSRNRFVTREEGRKLQDVAGIESADKDGYRGTTLFSEDLY